MIKKVKPFLLYIVLFSLILVEGLQFCDFDYDLWARLVAGMSVVQNWQVLKFDFLSYAPTHVWFDHEWGSGVVFYITQQIFGGVGLIVLQSLLLFVTFFFMIKTVVLRGVKNTSPYNFLFYFFAFCAINYLFKMPVRCHLFTFAFFALFLYLLEYSRNKFSNNKFSIGGEYGLAIYLPILMIIWNNLHGGCVSGIGLVFIYALGEALNKKTFKKYIYALITTIIVLPINPWGISYITFLLKATTMKRPEIVEWWPIYHPLYLKRYMQFKIFSSVIIFTQAIIFINALIKKNINFDKTKYFTLAVTLYLSIMHIKLIPLFVISSVIFCYNDFYKVFNKITFNIFNKIAIYKDLCVYAIIILFIVQTFKNTQDLSIKFTKYPFLATEFIKINHLKGNLLCNFGQGSYLAYKLYPQNKIFMDGRYEEVYFENMIPMLKDFHLVQGDWQKVLNIGPPDLILVEKMYPIFKHLQKDKTWTLVFDKDARFALFVRTKDLKKSYKMPRIESKYYNDTLFDTNIKFKSN